MSPRWTELQCIPLNDLKKENDEGIWCSTGADPIFMLEGKALEEGSFVGWVRIEVAIEFFDDACQPYLDWDETKETSEPRTITLHIPQNGVARATFHFESAVKGLRLHLTNSESRFRLFGARIRRTSRSASALAAAWPFLAKPLLKPSLFLSFFCDVCKLWWLSGNRALRLVARMLVTSQSGAAVRMYVSAQLASARHEAIKNRQERGPMIFGEKLCDRRDQSGRLQIGIGLIEHFGDIVACEPVPRYLRKKYPEAEISWVIRHEFRELIDHNPNIDRTIAVDCLTDWIKWRSHGLFDRIIDLHVNGRVCPHCRVTLEKTQGDGSITGDNHLFHGSLLGAFSLGAGLPALNDAPRVYIPEAARRDADALELPERFIVFHCRSNEIEKDWEYSKWDVLTQDVIRATGITVVEVGLTPVISHPANGVINLCGKTRLLVMAELIRRARAFVGVDSGPAHLANAVGTPSVVLLGQYQQFRKYNPFSGDFGVEKNVTLVRNMEGPAGMLPVSEVFDALEDLLVKGPMRPHQCEEDTCGETHMSLPAAEPSFDHEPRIIAFYLPQFHPIPENDKAWGKGFTEWRNVAKARAYYQGHYQPRVPGDLGYYDLRLPQVMEQQAALAREYGIHGFCYYFYWFNGRRLLNLPLDNMLRSGRPDFPFCYCWANENWTKCWDGADKEIIVTQKHTPEDDLKFIRFIMPALDDPRYIRINGKPLLLVYRTELFPNPGRTAELWRNEVRKAGLGDLYLVRCEGFDLFTIPESIGYDAAYEVPSFILPDSLRFTELESLKISKDFEGRILDYRKIVDFYCKREDVAYKRYRDPMLAWDNTPRHGRNALIFHVATPEYYGRWVANSLSHAKRRFVGEERLIFINAWNEWAEGSYLEPDLRFGRSFLEATLCAKEESRSNVEKQRLSDSAAAKPGQLDLARIASARTTL